VSDDGVKRERKTLLLVFCSYKTIFPYTYRDIRGVRRSDKPIKPKILINPNKKNRFYGSDKKLKSIKSIWFGSVLDFGF
jgi:hypothetical protein